MVKERSGSAANTHRYRMRRLEYPVVGLERTGEVALSVLEALPESARI